MAASRLFLLVGLALACTPPMAAPRGQVVLYVDTDMPVPRLASRLRVDVFTADASRWYVSRDISLPTASDWPASFGIVLPDKVDRGSVLVRLRAYPDGHVRDYSGERYQPRIDPTSLCDDVRCEAIKPDACCPAFVPTIVGDVSRTLEGEPTPVVEPEPNVTIDRLVRIDIAQHEVRPVSVVLHGTCVGAMADLGAKRSCVDSEGALVDAGPPDEGALASTKQGTFTGASTCSAPVRQATAGLFDEETCVPGGLFIFGSRASIGRLSEGVLPERTALISAFRMDVYEISVARWRAARARGMPGPDPPPKGNGNICTWTAQPAGMEDTPLTCASWDAYRRLCQFEGGDLPTELQWEYVAAAYGRDRPTRFPWGDDVLPCPNTSAAIYPNCGGVPVALIPRSISAMDSSVGLGIVGLGGDVAEWVLDGAVSRTSNCWLSQGLRDPACIVSHSYIPTIPVRVTRGACMKQTSLVLGRERFFSSSAENTSGGTIGARCVRKGDM